MTAIYSDELESKLIHLLQVDFPLVAEPYAEIGRRLGTGETDVIQRIEELKKRKIIRMIGPVMEARKLGYRSTLAAMCVPAENIEKASHLISEHPAISHGYEREGRFNLWITYSAPEQTDIEAGIALLSRSIGSIEVFSLPALRVFKIGAYFELDGNDNEEAPQKIQQHAITVKTTLSNQEKLVINAVQQDLPLIQKPFTVMAESAGMKTGTFLNYCGSLLERGIMRRYSASINHRRAGYTANAMVCWLVTGDMVEKAGAEMSKTRQVSHCYERRTNPLWPHNLYTMLHARSRDAALELITGLARQTGLHDYQVLFSTREIKKNRINYVV